MKTKNKNYINVFITFCIFSYVILANAHEDEVKKQSAVSQRVLIPISDINWKIQFDKNQNKWHIIFECDKWKILSYSYTYNGADANEVIEILYGEFVGESSKIRSSCQSVLEVKENLPAKLYITSQHGKKIHIKSFTGKEWVEK